MKRTKKFLCLALSVVIVLSLVLTACGKEKNNGVTEIELVQYKQEAVDIFEQFEKEFNETHKDIHLTIASPSDATTVLKTRFIREDYPDIIGIGGDVDFSNFMDADILADVSDFEGMKNVNPAYINILESLEYVPTEGTYGVPYMANAAGILYNKEMFAEHGWKIPTTFNELMALCEQIKSEGITPFYFGLKDTWTCLAPWNALAVGIAPADVCTQVSEGKTTFTKEYKEVAEKIVKLIPYGEKGPVAYGYNDACTAFANGESAMYTIGSYAVPQILSVNPDMKIDSFVMPANDDASKQILNSGVDLQFCVTKACKNKKAAYEVLSFLQKKENVQKYIDNQNAVPCQLGDYKLPSMLDGMQSYIKEGKMADFQDHHYPSEMAVDAKIQTMIIKNDVPGFLSNMDTDWVRYNRDLIRKVQDYQKEHGEEAPVA